MKLKRPLRPTNPAGTHKNSTEFFARAPSTRLHSPAGFVGLRWLVRNPSVQWRPLYTSEIANVTETGRNGMGVA